MCLWFPSTSRQLFPSTWIAQHLDSLDGERTFSLSNDPTKHKSSSSSSWGILHFQKMHVQQAIDVDYAIQQKAETECSYGSFWFPRLLCISFFQMIGDTQSFSTFLKYNIINTFLATSNFLYFFLKIHLFHVLITKTFQILKNFQNV